MADTSTHSWKLLYEAGRQALQARKLQEAEQSFSAALQLAEDFAAGDPRLSATLNALARIYSLQRRYLAAAALLNRLLEVTERTLGPDHVQVAGVLTNLAEMYTHLGAAREELELRERVLGVRAGDPTADPVALQRLRERVDELRSALVAEDAPEPDDADDLELLPSVRPVDRSEPVAAVAERAQPVASSMPSVEPVGPARLDAPAVASEVVPVVAPIAAASAAVEVTRAGRDDAFRSSPATPQLAIAPWPRAAASGTTSPGGRTIEVDRLTLGAFAPMSVIPHADAAAQPALSLIVAGDHGLMEVAHGESRLAHVRRLGARSGLLKIAAGVVLVAGVLAARDYVKGVDDERTSAGSVNLAKVANTTPAAVAAPTTEGASGPESRTVEHLVAERRAEREDRSATDGDTPRASKRGESGDRSDPVTDRPVRIPSPVEIERALRGVDGAVKAVDQRTRAATDSAIAIKLQAPTFKKVRLADPGDRP